MRIEREVGDETVQSTVFFFQLPEPAQFTHAQVGVFLVPGGEGRVTDAELPAESADGSAACRIASTLCSSENFDRFIGPLLSCVTAEAAILL